MAGPGPGWRPTRPGDVCHRVHGGTAGHLQTGLRIDRRGFEEFLAKSPAQIVDVPVEAPPGLWKEYPPYQGEAVGVEPGRSHREEYVARLDALRPEHTVRLDDSGRRPRHVVLVRPEESWVLGGLTAEERTPGDGAALRNSLDDAGDPLRVDLPAGDVVGEEERLRAADHEVVDQHGDEVDADGVVLVERLRDRHLGSDAVRAGGEQRLPHPLEGRSVEEPGEPADAAEHLGAPRGLDPTPHQVDCALASLHRDAGRRIGSGVRRIGACHVGGSDRRAAVKVG